VHARPVISHESIRLARLPSGKVSKVILRERHAASAAKA